MMAKLQSGSSQGASMSVAQMLGMMVVNTVTSIATEILPMAIAPPIWNLRPLPCVPMVTGKNCFGAIKYPITFSDFIMAKQIDESLDSLVDAFPALFDQRTEGQSYPYYVYARCFQAYMSMHCSALFPTCTTLQAQQIFIPLFGRMPMCISTCVNVLKVCPGFLPSDVLPFCETYSVLPIPFCAFGNYDRFDAIPPPVKYEDENSDCPQLDPDQDLAIDPSLDEDFQPAGLDMDRLPILRTVE